MRSATISDSPYAFQCILIDTITIPGKVDMITQLFVHAYHSFAILVQDKGGIKTCHDVSHGIKRSQSVVAVRLPGSTTLVIALVAFSWCSSSLCGFGLLLLCLSISR